MLEFLQSALHKGFQGCALREGAAFVRYADAKLTAFHAQLKICYKGQINIDAPFAGFQKVKLRPSTVYHIFIPAFHEEVLNGIQSSFFSTVSSQQPSKEGYAKDQTKRSVL